MRRRPAARLLVLDPNGRLLLFRFVHKRGPLAGGNFWATPGGGLEDGETFEEAAIRELGEETGLRVDDVGAEVFRRELVLPTPEGELVISEERFFIVHAPHARLSKKGWTALEIEVMTEHRW